MNKQLCKMLLGFSVFGTLSTPKKAEAEDFKLESGAGYGEIQDIVLGADQYALKTKGAKIDGVEYPVWIGNTNNLSAAFSTPWMTNACSSCAYYKDDLYVAPKGETNYLYRVSSKGTQIPNFDYNPIPMVDSSKNTLPLKAPYLYATPTNLYAIANTDSGVNVYSLNSKAIKTEQPKDVCTNTALQVSNVVNIPDIKKEDIKDIVFYTDGQGKDNLYVLTTNKTTGAEVYHIREGQNVSSINLNTTAKQAGFYVVPYFDHTTSMAIHHKNQNISLLFTNANYPPNDGQDGLQIQLDSYGNFGSPSAFQPTISWHTSAIGSSGNKCYAEQLAPNRTQRYNQPGDMNDSGFGEQKNTYEEDATLHIQPIHKFVSPKQGIIYGISKDRIYRIYD